jgi:hypothetical protein
LNTCHICHTPTNTNTCQHCQTTIRNQLQDIATYTTQAQQELTPNKGGDGRTQTIPIGIRLNALDLTAGNDILPTLEEWERDWRHTYNLTPYGPASAARNQGKPQSQHIHGVLEFLTTWLPTAAQTHPAISDFAHEIRQLRQQAQHAANQQPRQSWNISCPADMPLESKIRHHTGDNMPDGQKDTSECGNVLRVTGEDFGAYKTCKHCNTHWEVNRLIQVAATSQQANIWIDPETAANQTGISQRTLRQWAQHGKIKRHKGLYEYHSLINLKKS